MGAMDPRPRKVSWNISRIVLSWEGSVIQEDHGQDKNVTMFSHGIMSRTRIEMGSIQ